MKRILLGCALVVFAGCAGSGMAPVPDVAMAVRAGVSYETLQQGHAVYLGHCGRCHAHVMPQDVSKADWHVVVPGMAWNAGITPQQERDLSAYLLAARR